MGKRTNEQAGQQRNTFCQEKHPIRTDIFAYERPKEKASKDHCHTDGVIDMTASEQINELISEHADGKKSHVNWKFSYDTIH